MLLLISFEVLSKKGWNQDKMVNNTFFVRNVTPSFPHEPSSVKQGRRRSRRKGANCSNDDTQTQPSYINQKLKSYSKEKLFTKSRKFHESTIKCTLMSPSVAKTPKKSEKLLRTINLIDIKVNKTNKTKVIKSKQLKLNQFSLINFTRATTK